MLKHTNVVLEDWDSALSDIRKLIDYVHDTFGESFGKVPYSDDGLSQVPITNKDWARWVGYEHDEQTLWFHRIVQKQPDGTCVKKYYNEKAAWFLARSVTWNAAMYIHFILHPRAMYKALLQSLACDSTCPTDIAELVASQLSHLCYGVLSIVCDENGAINRCGVQLLKDNLDTKLRRRACTNKALRRNICMQLVAQGIGGLETRIQQRNRIIQVLKGYPELKGSAVHAIERMLTLDKRLLKMNCGVSILLPYTDADKRIVHDNALAQERKANALVRAQALLEKIRSKVPLTSAERKFKSRHKELFHEERLSDEPVR